MIERVADTDSTALILGESGTGKELVARALHQNSRRQHAAFVPINCSALPENLLESSRLEAPIFTPSTKAELGAHDENITFDEAVKLCGNEIADRVSEISIEIYSRARDFAWDKGIIIADTKFEFGFVGDELILIDEVLTPDSSRFWPKDAYTPGGPQKSYDKQYLRDYLRSLDWDKAPPAPELPDEVIENTQQKYLEALTLLTGHGL